jgi:glutamate racemase
VDSAATTAAFVGQWLRDTGRARRGGEAAKTRFLATDAPARFARVGRVFLGHEIAESSVELVDL